MSELDDHGAIVPPHSTEAEQSVLGALLLDNAQVDRVSDMLEPGDFYHRDYGAIYTTIVRLVVANKPADVITVFEAGQHDITELNALAQGALVTANARRYAEIVRERALQRRLMAIGRAVVERARGGAGVADQVDKAVTELLQVAQAKAEREPVDIADAMPQWIDDLSSRATGQSPAMPTGLVDLDRLTSGGIWPGELWVIGARPSMGKSALSLTLSRNMARDWSVLVLSQEDSMRTLVARMVASAGKVNLADLRNPARANALDQDLMWTGVSEAADILRQLHLRVDDQPGLTMMDVRRKVQQVKRRHGLHVLVVDYLQLMVGEGETRSRELGEISNGLKRAAKEFGIGVVLLSQLSRKADERSGPPQMQDLRESGDIEGAADLIGMLYREVMRKPTPENKHYAELHVVKQKNGPTDTVPLHFDGRYQRFANWDGQRPHGASKPASSSEGMR